MLPIVCLFWCIRTRYGGNWCKWHVDRASTPTPRNPTILFWSGRGHETLRGGGRSDWREWPRVYGVRNSNGPELTAKVERDRCPLGRWGWPAWRRRAEEALRWWRWRRWWWLGEGYDLFWTRGWGWALGPWRLGWPWSWVLPHLWANRECQREGNRNRPKLFPKFLRLWWVLLWWWETPRGGWRRSVHWWLLEVERQRWGCAETVVWGATPCCFVCHSTGYLIINTNQHTNTPSLVFRAAIEDPRPSPFNPLHFHK